MKRCVLWCALAASLQVNAAPPFQGVVDRGPVDRFGEGRRALAARQFAQARVLFSAVLREQPASIEALMGEGDAELGLRDYEAAELTYRKVTTMQPMTWLAHKNLVIVEAALGRWEEFDRERALLHAARERGAKGIGWHENEVIDAFDVAGARWIVRAYDEPAGKAETVYNFERFAADGRVLEYISLEPAAVTAAGGKTYRLNFYTGKAHGTVTNYPGGEPSYEQVRGDVRRWLLRQSRSTRQQH